MFVRWILCSQSVYGSVLPVDSMTGGRLLSDMKPYPDRIRFRPFADLRVWNGAMTNGVLSEATMPN